MWVVLGIEPDIAELFACALQIQFKDDQFFIREDFQHTDTVGVMRSGLLTVFRFRHFCDTRWLSVGFSARALVASMLLGIRSLVDEIKRPAPEHCFYLNGFYRLQANVAEFVICAAIVARVRDAAHLELMEDARLLRRMQEVKEAVAEEMQWIASISDFVWITLRSVFQTTPVPDLKKLVEIAMIRNSELSATSPASSPECVPALPLATTMASKATPRSKDWSMISAAQAA